MDSIRLVCSNHTWVLTYCEEDLSSLWGVTVTLSQYDIRTGNNDQTVYIVLIIYNSDELKKD